MLRLKRNNKAQARMVEYAMLIAMTMAVAVTMTVYFKRNLQARVRDSHAYMVSEVYDRTRGQFDGNLYYAYEPYYAHTESDVTRSMDEQINLLGGRSTGIFVRRYDQAVDVATNSETAPPSEFDRTTPQPAPRCGAGCWWDGNMCNCS